MKRGICWILRLEYEQQWDGFKFVLLAFILIAATFALSLGLPIAVNDGIRTGLLVWGLFTGLFAAALGVLGFPLCVYTPTLGYMEREIPLRYRRR